MKQLEQLTWKDDLSDTEEGDLEETMFELGTMSLCFGIAEGDEGVSDFVSRELSDEERKEFRAEGTETRESERIREES